VELGEIEAALAAHPVVRDAAVIARSNEGSLALTACIVCRSGAEAPTSGELREFLSHSLPDGMLPAAFVVVDEIPIAPGGKRDRARLAREVSETEQRIARIWSRVLGVAELGVHDNFFDLGGDSLRLMEVRGGLEEEFGTELPLAVLFEHTSVARIAERLATPPEGPFSDQATDDAVARGARRKALLTHRAAVRRDRKLP
jgi:acyl carrier protein